VYRVSSHLSIQFLKVSVKLGSRQYFPVCQSSSPYELMRSWSARSLATNEGTPWHVIEMGGAIRQFSAGYATPLSITEICATREELNRKVAISPQTAAHDSHSPGIARLPVAWIR
jgi:hypothetical protein